MSRAGEARILRRAVEKGILAERDVDEAADLEPETTGRWGPRIERLLADGRLDEFAVAALAEEVATLPLDEGDVTQDAPQPAAPSAVAAPAGWERYQIVARLGAGGGGEVFRAHDPRLARDVALKFLHAERPELLVRFRREAQAQARVEHEHVCKVFEVGEVGGRSFIAMQLVDGETLGAAAPGMTIEERVRIVRQAAEAVHAAHRLGLVHRDLKPGNVLVERDPDRAHKPWVMDFGLAREMDRSQSSMAEAVAGTPAFMAPEQARGETAIDRRCDVYGLGATLFAALAGRPPFLGSTIEILLQVVSDEAPPLRRIVPTLPADLEIIVARCLEKDPGSRYDSARALADELGRFLDGEPILARPPGWPERARRWLRRHRALVAVAALGLAAVAVVATLWVRSALRAREEARLAQRFGAEAQAIEGMMRVAHLLPAHDIRPDRARVRERMRALEETMARGGAAAEGPGRYALGRGALAIGDRAAARAHLERAWTGGYRAPEVAYALGQALGEEYEAALDEALAIPAGEEREAKRRDAVRDLRDPALAYLRAARGAASEAPAMVEGMIAFREDRFDDALARLAEAQREVPERYEARRLIGDVYAHMASERRDQGDAEGALALAEHAAEAYRAAVEIARSDPSIYAGECLRRYYMLTLELDRGLPGRGDALAACDRALVVDPDDPTAYQREAAILSRTGQAEAQHGQDPRPTLARAVARADEALARSPRNHEALWYAGNAWLIQADRFEVVRGIDPRPSYERAIERYERSITIHPLSAVLTNMGTAHNGIADWEQEHGGDPLPHWERAAQSLRRASALAPRNAVPPNVLCIQLASRTSYDLGRGADPRSSVEAAIAAARRSIELNPGNGAPWNCLGFVWMRRAFWERARGVDCRPSVEEAIQSYRKASEIMRDYVYAYDNAAEAWQILALQRMDRGEDPSEALREARSMIGVARGLSATDKYSYLQQARVELLAARFASHAPDAAARFAEAITAVDRAAELDPKDADVREAEADICRWRAELRLSRGEPARADIDRGIEAASRALVLNPSLASALAVKATLLAQKARGERDPELRSKQESEARAELRKALEMNPLLKKDYPEP